MMQTLLTVICEDRGKISFPVIRISAFTAGKEKNVMPLPTANVDSRTRGVYSTSDAARPV